MSQPDTRRYFKHGTLPQLRLFEAIARLGTFARAAQELHMAQPTASLQIKKLTATVGVPLFQQVGKRVHLTEAGRRLHESCGHLFRVFAALEDSLAGLRVVEGDGSGDGRALEDARQQLGREPASPRVIGTTAVSLEIPMARGG